jgi:hypothetical protein
VGEADDVILVAVSRLHDHIIATIPVQAVIVRYFVILASRLRPAFPAQD